jgi:hypothetical protein
MDVTARKLQLNFEMIPMAKNKYQTVYKNVFIIGHIVNAI